MTQREPKITLAAHQLKVLQEYQNPRDGKLRLEDIRAMFEAMKDQANRPDRYRQ